MLNSMPLDNENFIAANSNEAINEIIRGEIAAMHAYQQVFEQLKDDPDAIHLDMLFEEHRSAVEFWRTQATREFSYPAEDAGVWGSAAAAFVGVSKLFGDRSALTALRKGEEYGLDLYREMLEREELSPALKEVIEEKFIVQQKAHISTVSKLIKEH